MIVAIAIGALVFGVGFPPPPESEIICSQLTPVPCGFVEVDDCWTVGGCNPVEFENIENTTFQVVPASGGGGHYIYESNGSIIPCWMLRGCEEQTLGVGECTVSPVVSDPVVVDEIEF